MSQIEFYFSIINIILLIIMFVWSYITNYCYNKRIDEIKKIEEEIEKIKDEIKNEEQFYKTIITNLSDYLNLINKNKKQVIKNSPTIPTPPIIKKEEKKETTEKKETFFQQVKNFIIKRVKINIPKKNEGVKEVKEVKKIIPNPNPNPNPNSNQIPNVNKGDIKKPQKEIEPWKKK